MVFRGSFDAHNFSRIVDDGPDYVGLKVQQKTEPAATINPYRMEEGWGAEPVFVSLPLSTRSLQAEDGKLEAAPQPAGPQGQLSGAAR